MSLHLAAELFTSALLLITCLSHITAPAQWSRLFQDAFKHPAAGLVIGTLTLVIALPILIVHWRWTGDLRSIVTIIAWGWTFKGTLYLLLPGTPARVGSRHVQHPRRFVIAGAIGVGLAALALIGTFQAHEWRTT